MNMTKEQLRRMQAAGEARAHEIWMIRLAVKNNNLSSSNHPVNIRKRIAQEQQLLDEALAADS